MNEAPIIVEARAKIVWGDSPQVVREFLVINGIDQATADAKIREFQNERNRDLRKLGLVNLVVGVPLILSAIGVFCYFVPHSFSSGMAKGLTGVVIAGLFGIVKVIRGVSYLLRPQSEHGSLADLPDPDAME
jgi:uncharacterized protein YjeT (DUF2065 family)